MQLVTQLESAVEAKRENSHTYGPLTYHSFPNLEERRCSLCGRQGPNNIDNKPLEVYIPTGFRSQCLVDHNRIHFEKDQHGADARRRTHTADNNRSTKLGPRRVTSQRVTKSIDTPVRASKLPAWLIRLPASNVITDRYQLVTSGPMPREKRTASSAPRDRNNINCASSGKSQSVGLKLNHSHDLFDAESSPFEHSHGVTGLSATLRAESTSPSAERCNTLRSLSVTSESLDRTLQLRGGGRVEEDSSNTVFGKLKRQLLTCHSHCLDESDVDTGAFTPLLPVVSRGRSIKVRQQLKSTSLAPPSQSQQYQSTASVRDVWPDTGDFAPETTFTTTISGPISNSPKRSLSASFSALNISIFSRRRASPPTTQPMPTPQSRVTSPPTPYLRGGADSPERTPSTLFWLAGGTGRKPISFDGWKRSRPKQRMGGLLGMTVFGDRYGQEYKVAACAADGVEIECSTSVKIVTDDVASVKEVEIEETKVEQAVLGEARVTEVNGAEKENRAHAPASVEASGPSATVGDEPEQGFTTGAEDDEPIHMPLSPAPAPVADEVPLCSGALPVENAAQPNVPQDVGHPAVKV